MVLVKERSIITLFCGASPPRMTIFDVFCSGVDTFDSLDTMVAFLMVVDVDKLLARELDSIAVSVFVFLDLDK